MSREDECVRRVGYCVRREYGCVRGYDDSAGREKDIKIPTK